MEKLDQFLRANNLTQKDFGVLIGLSQPSVHRILNRKTFPRQKTLKKITEVTDGAVTANDFAQ